MTRVARNEAGGRARRKVFAAVAGAAIAVALGVVAPQAGPPAEVAPARAAAPRGRIGPVTDGRGAPAADPSSRGVLSARAPLPTRPELLARLAPGADAREVERRFPLAAAASADPALDALGWCVLRAAPGADLPALAAALRASGLALAAEPNILARGAGAACCGTDRPAEAAAAREIPVPDLAAIREAAGAGSREILVALLDSGVDLAHADLAGNLVAGWDFVDGDAETADENGHGTAVAGVIAAREGNGIGAAGVASFVSLAPVRVADARGEAAVADLARGLVWAADRGARVIVVPLGTTVPAGVLEDAVRYALARGALIVASAGNDNVNHALYPAAYPGVLAVGAAGPGAELAHRTALAARVDVFAPGENLPTTWNYGAFGAVSGTSAAAAYVGGLAAVLLARDPGLDATDLRQALREGARPIEALAPARDVFPAGRLDPALAARRARRDLDDLAVESLEVLPRRPLPGERTVLRARVRNASHRAIAGAAVTFALEGAPVAEAPCPALEPGDRVAVEAAIDAPRAAAMMRAHAFTARVAGPYCDEEPSNDEARAALRLGRAPVADVAIAALDLASIEPARGLLRFRLEVENRGNVAVPLAIEAKDAIAAAEVLAPAVEVLPPGARAEATILVHLAEGAPRAPGRLEVAVRPAGREDADLARNAATFEWSVRPLDERPVKPQYQQSADIDIIADAPWRVRPGHPYMPVLVFIASKGDPLPSTEFELRTSRIRVRTDALAAAGSGTLIYDEARATDITPLTSRYPAGLEVVDENGAVVLTPAGLPDANLFRDEKLTLPGRYNILRIPRAALSVPAVPAAAEDRYLEVALDWASLRPMIFQWGITRTGTARKTLRVTFADRDLARLPGEGRHYDAHIHTIAEWYLRTGWNPIAPMKAYGGPIPMLKEAALAVGLTGALDDVYEKLITTDHNCFYETQDPIADAIERRPWYGPTSPDQSRDAAGVIWSEYARMRGIFGRTAAEEIAFSQPQASAAVPVPIGAHLLAYRAEHIEGPWHGGSALAAQYGDTTIIELGPLLARLAKTNPVENARAFVYAAHPFAGQSWISQNIALAFGLGPHRGAADFTTVKDDDFLVKGHQLWNMRNARELPHDKIDWMDMDPWRDATWRTGAPNWDASLYVGLTAWHEHVAELLDYELVNRPGIRFPRKLYILAGSDAHGDFNMTEDRAGANLPFRSTFMVTDSAFGKARTYALPDAKDGGSLDERAMDAIAEGNTVVTDGPLVTFAIDAEGRFDSKTLKWHDAVSKFEDEDGRIGGGGAFDGELTALVPARSHEVFFGYRYEDSAEGGSDQGAVRHVKIYRDRPGEPNPTRAAVSAYGNSYRIPVSVGRLAALGAGRALEERIDPLEEGLVEGVTTAFSLGAFTGPVDPDHGQLGVEERRCYTNPIYVVPVETQAVVAQVDTAKGVIPPGGLIVRYAFSRSMEPRSYEIEVKALDASGESTDATQPAITRLVPRGGWTGSASGLDTIYEARNERAIPLDVFRYPGGNDVTFVVYFRERPRDAFGNALNPVAFTFTTQGIGTGGGYGAPVGGGSGAGARRGGGCAVGAASAVGAIPPGEAIGALLPLTLAVAALVALRKRRR